MQGFARLGLNPNDVESELETLRSRIFEHRNVLAGIPLLYALFSRRWEWENAHAVWATSIVLALLGVTLRAWSVCHCDYAQGRPKRLTTTGPYAIIRNPLYVGNVLILAGAVAASELAWVLPILVAWAFGIYSVAIRHEEARLLDRYGDDFVSYAARVPRWIPSHIFAASTRTKLHQPLARALLKQCLSLAILLPFAVKEIGFLASWPRP